MDDGGEEEEEEEAHGEARLCAKPGCVPGERETQYANTFPAFIE